MKKRILALGAVAALGGFGFAGSAHAIVYFGNGTAAPTADTVALHPAGTGHYLFAPYYSAQGNRITLLNIANTDTVNGKVVKVRFRGAANSDDVLDFTLFLSPGDVWTGSVNAPTADGPARLATRDTSCTLPLKSAWSQEASANSKEYQVDFRTHRLPQAQLTEVQRNAQTKEGYVEFLNMADVPQTLAVAGLGKYKGVDAGGANPLFTATKHNNGTAPCTDVAFDDLLTTAAPAGDIRGYGLDSPTGGLMGSFAVVNRDTIAAYGSAHTAVVATTAAEAAKVNGVYAAGTARIAFAPQSDDPVTATDAATHTADPLLRSGLVQAAWYDLPDMSTPLLATNSPVEQASNLTAALSKPTVYNEYVVGTSTGVNFATEWVLSQPTRRYHAAVQYSGGGNDGAASRIIWNRDMLAAAAATPLDNVVASSKVATDPVAVITTAGTLVDNRYAGMTLGNGAFANMGCWTKATSGATDREEYAVARGAVFSPGAPVSANPVCGEVAIRKFGDTNTPTVLGSRITMGLFGALPPASPEGTQAGTAQITFANGTPAGNSLRNIAGLPVVGFAATSATVSGGNFGWAVPHRYK